MVTFESQSTGNVKITIDGEIYIVASSLSVIPSQSDPESILITNQLTYPIANGLSILWRDVTPSGSTRNDVVDYISTFFFHRSVGFFDDRFVLKTGDTMTGDLIVPTLYSTGLNIDGSQIVYSEGVYTSYALTNQISGINITGNTNSQDIFIENGYGIQSTDFTKYNTTYDYVNATHTPGQLNWNSDDNTLEMHTDVDGVKLQLGQENFVRVTNRTSNTITNGTVVVLSGATGNRPKIILASNTESNSHNVIGVVTSDILDKHIGYVTTEGLVRDLDTSLYTEGTKLWLSTGGTFTNIEPISPIHKVVIGFVVRQHDNQGVILVNIDTGSDISDLHDVKITNVKNKDMLVYSGNTWNNTDTLYPLHIYAGTDTDYIDISSSGVCMKGSATVWNDASYVIPMLRVGSTTSIDTFFGNFREYTLDIAANDFIEYSTFEIPHWSKEFSRYDFHVHWATGNGVADTRDRYVKFQLDIMIANLTLDGKTAAFSGASGITYTTVYTATGETMIPSGTTERTHIYTELHHNIPSTFAFGAQVKTILKRINASGTGPTNKPFILQIGSHMEQDCIGSKQEYVK